MNTVQAYPVPSAINVTAVQTVEAFPFLEVERNNQPKKAEMNDGDKLVSQLIIGGYGLLTAGSTILGGELTMWGMEATGTSQLAGRSIEVILAVGAGMSGIIAGSAISDLTSKLDPKEDANKILLVKSASALISALGGLLIGAVATATVVAAGSVLKNFI